MKLMGEGAQQATWLAMNIVAGKDTREKNYLHQLLVRLKEVCHAGAVHGGRELELNLKAGKGLDDLPAGVAHAASVVTTWVEGIGKVHIKNRTGLRVMPEVAMEARYLQKLKQRVSERLGVPVHIRTLTPELFGPRAQRLRASVIYREGSQETERGVSIACPDAVDAEFCVEFEALCLKELKR